MLQEHYLLTPEKVELRFRLAGLGSRGAALFFDILIYGVGALAFYFGSMALLASVGAPADFMVLAEIVALYLFFLGFLIYNTLFLAYWRGQTLGKRMFGVRVIQANGAPLTTMAATIRSILLIADFLPMWFLLGAVCIFVTQRAQRVGDMAAGTIAVTTRAPKQVKNRERPINTDVHPLEGHVGSVALLNAADLQALRVFLMRYPELPVTARERVYDQIWQSVSSRTELDVPPGVSPLGVLEALAVKLNRELMARA